MARNAFGERHGPEVLGRIGNYSNEENSCCLHSDCFSIAHIVAERCANRAIEKNNAGVAERRITSNLIGMSEIPARVIAGRSVWVLPCHNQSVSVDPFDPRLENAGAHIARNRCSL